MKTTLAMLALLSLSPDVAVGPELARTHLARGTKALETGAFSAAIQECKAGIKALGNRYGGPETIDDTGQKLVVAQMNENDNRLDVAAAIYCKVLNTRLSVAKQP